MPITYTQDEFETRSVDVKHINPSIMEGERLSTSILGPNVAVRLERYPPTNLQPPVISGDFKIPSTLVCSEGVWDAAPQPLFTYQWYHDGNPIPGATSNQWTSSLSFDAQSITCIVTATNNQDSASQESNNIIVELILPIRVEEQRFGIVSGLNQEHQQNLNHFRGMVTTGLWVDDYVTAMTHKVNVISGLWVENRLDTEFFNVAAVSGIQIENTSFVVVNDIYMTEFFEFIEAAVVQNHNAELDLANWTVTSGTLGIRTSNPSPAEGTKYFFGGDTANTTAHQDIVIPVGHHGLVDNSEFFTELNWKQSSFDTQDKVALSVQYLDAGNLPLGIGNFEVGSIAAPEQVWTKYNPGLTLVPPLTRTIRIHMNFERISGIISNGYVDDIKLNFWKNIHAT